jgi:serine/threonine protein kinase
LKSSNILIEKYTYNAKITDLGCSTIVLSDNQMENVLNQNFKENIVEHNCFNDFTENINIKQMEKNESIYESSMNSNFELFEEDKIFKNSLKSGLLQTQNEFGTLTHIAPECLNDNLFHKKSDIYSFGCIIFEILTHQIPWKFDGVFDIKTDDKMIFIEEFKKISLRNLKPSIPKNEIKMDDEKNIDFLLDLCEKCWSTNHLDRPSFSDIIILFDKFLI